MNGVLEVVICDDEETAISIISASVEALFTSRGISVNIQKFVSAKSCYQYLKTSMPDLLFLDIAMPEADGIALAKKLVARNLDKKPDIIFVSNNQSRVFDSFQVLPFGFVRKDNFMNDISNVLKRYVETRLMGEEKVKKFELRDSNGISVLNASKVTYIESYRNTQTVYVAGGEKIVLHSTMDHIYEQVKNYDFVRIHKGFIVGYKHIKNFGRNEIILDTGETLPVGRVYYKDAMEQYMTYIRTNGIKGIG
ncbi:LytTR family DNA-binding domain-containing protein [Blautia schinkii]|nr:LytTR family DNA-binding domain-containing protein [Blautia schinkii]